VLRSIWTVTFLILISCAAASMSGGKRQPEGDSGIAARYPGDKGIENDPNVVFIEKFDEGSLEAVFKRWNSVGGKER